MKLLSALFIFSLSAIGLGASPSDSATVHSLYKKSQSFADENDFEQAEILIREGLDLSREINDSALEGTGYAELSEILFFKKDLQTATEYAERASELCGDGCGAKTLVKINSILGGILGLQGDYTQSLKFYNKALDIAKGAGLEDTYINVLFNTAGTLGDLGRYEEMLSALIRCREHYESSGDIRNLATIHNNLGLSYFEHFHEPETARSHYRKSMVLNRRIGNDWNLARNYHNLALIFIDENELDSAGYYIGKAIELKRKVDDQGGLAMLYHSMGKLMLHRKEFSQAKNYYSRSKAIAERFHIAEGQYYTNLGLGWANDSLGLMDTALSHYEKAFEFAKISGSTDFLRQAQENIYRHHKLAGSTADALAALEQLRVYDDSLFSLMSDEKLLDLKTRYESELQEKENAVLRAEHEKQEAEIRRSAIFRWVFIGIVIISVLIVLVLFFAYRARNKAYRVASERKTELEKLNSSLQNQTDELNDINLSKDKLFSVISHDLRSPLTTLQGCLDILSAEEISEDEKKELLHELRNETGNTLKALDDLLAWSKIQMGGIVLHKSDFDINHMISEVMELYKRTAALKNVKLVFNTAGEQQLVNADPYQIRTVVRNLLSNAIKFTPENANVEVRVEEIGGEVQICIIDEGKGISEAEKQKIFDRNQYYTSAGTKGEMGSGVGLILSLEYLHRNSSELVFEPNEPAGTKACFTLQTAREAELA